MTPGARLNSNKRSASSGRKAPSRFRSGGFFRHNDGALANECAAAASPFDHPKVGQFAIGACDGDLIDIELRR